MGKVVRWSPRKREMTRKTTKYMEKARNSKKLILIFGTKVTARIMLGMKAITLKIMTIRRSM